MTDTASAAPSEQDLFERVFPMPEGCMRCGDTYAPTEYSAWSASAFIERFKGWQAARAQPTPPAVAGPLTADDIREPKNGQQWRVEWWNESCRMMLPKNMRLDSFQSYQNGTLMFTIKESAHGIGIKKGDSNG